MKRSALTRKTPMKRGTSTLKQSAPIKRKAPKRREGRAPKLMLACRGQCCFLRFPGICRSYEGDPTVVAAHENQGKGMGLKVADDRTVPACFDCHAEYDQGKMSREQKRDAWLEAFAAWQPIRDRGE